MAIHSAKGAKRKPRPQVSKSITAPSPIGGIDGRVPLSADNPNVCLYSYNLVPSEFGVRVRDGYREWQVGVPTTDTEGIGTVIPFTANDGADKLFVATNEGIYDVTTAEGTPTLAVAFGDTSFGAGKGVYTQYLSSANEEYIFYADRVNGLFRYDATLGTWAIAAGITGVDVADVNFIVSHKLRLWFCVKDSSIAYYLPIDSIAGLAESFNFGSTFKHGGALVGVYSWTVDGGEGVDDYIVAISKAGDVIPFRGSDPTQTDWSTVGTYYVGRLAQGNLAASQYGGNLTILSSFGLTQLSDLLRGVDPRVSDTRNDSIGNKIASILRTDMRQYGESEGWGVAYIPQDGAVIVTTPKRTGNVCLQYVYNISVQGWGFWREVPISALDSWKGVTYFGTADGRVCAMDAIKDNIQITPPVGNEFNGLDINFSILTAYSTLGAPSVFKQGQLIRPDFLVKGSIDFQSKFMYDYDSLESNFAGLGQPSPEGIWDTGLWDTAVWTGSTLEDRNSVSGGAGIGRFVAVAIQGTAPSDTILASIDISWTTGGIL